MLSSKSKSGLSDASINKAPPATPRASKLGRAGSFKTDPDTPSPQQTSRVSIDRSPRSGDAKAVAERRSPRISTPDKQPRGLKGSEAQTPVGVAQEDLKKVKERLAAVEKEKNRIFEELKGAKKSADEANEKLQESLAAQKKAVEASEIDKFRADELEQAGIEAAQKREEEWQKELEDGRNQHALDVAALVATTQELQRVKQELLMTTEAKKSALSHADDAVNIAEINAEKVGLLSGEVSRLKALLDSALESKSSEVSEGMKSELDVQTQLTTVQSELKAANELLASIEREKSQILEELQDAKRLSDEANEKLIGNLAIQQKAQEALEMEKNRSKELEEESIKAAKREEEWQENLESTRNQHAADVAAFKSTIQELERVKHELAMTADAKNAALSHADDALKIAEVNAEKVKLLSGEVSRLKSLLDSKLELDAEVSALKDEIKKAKEAENKLEVLIDELRIEVGNAKKAESDADQLVDKWKKKAELLEVQLDEANKSRKSSSDSLASVMKQLEENNHVMQEKESEISNLKTKVDSLEPDIARFKADLEESSQCLNVAQEEALEMNQTIEILKSELQVMVEAKMHSLSNEKAAASRIESLMDERNKLVSELEITKRDEEKVKQAMEDLTSTLHEVSTEAREAQEKFIAKQLEAENAHAQIEDLKLTIKKMQESQEVAVNEAKHKIAQLQETVERLEREVEKSKCDWESKDVDFVSSITRLEEEITTIKIEMDRIAESLKGAEHKLKAANENEAQIQSKLKHVEFEANLAKMMAEAAKTESLRLKEMLLDKENELQRIFQDNDELQVREAGALKKVKELSSLLAEATMKKPDRNVEPSLDAVNFDQSKQVDTLQEDAHEGGEADNTQSEVPTTKIEEHSRDHKILEEENENNNAKVEHLKIEGDVQENGKVMDKDLSAEEHESDSTDDELESKTNGTGFDHGNGLGSDNIENGSSSPTKQQQQQQQQQQKKKKAFMQKFGSLLKMKSSSK